MSDLPRPWANVLCHCRACSRARGASPAHLMLLPTSHLTITKGITEKKLKVCNGMGKMVHAFCTECGCYIYQFADYGPAYDYRAVFPVNFHIETPDPTTPCGSSCKLPTQLLPTAHLNYENRVMDATDDLPKWTTFMSERFGPRLNNDGTLYQEEKKEVGSSLLDQDKKEEGKLTQ